MSSPEAHHDADRQQRVLRYGLIAVPAAMLLGAVRIPGLSEAAGLVPPVVLVLWVIYVRRLPRLLISGLLAGGGLGLIALGGGMRVAMRLVALSGGRREVSLGGTVFLLVGGAMIGAVTGLGIAAALRAWPKAGRIPGLAVAGFLYLGIVVDSETFQEFLHEGFGGWMNFPLFVLPLAAYGWWIGSLIAAIDAKIPVRPRRIESERTTDAL